MARTHGRRRYMVGLVGAAALMLAASACGSDNDNQGSGDGQGTTASGPQKLIVAQTDVKGIPMIGGDGGVELGAYKDAGIELELTNAEKPEVAMAAGSLDISLDSPTRVIPAIMKGLDATLVGPTIDWWGQHVIVRAGSTETEISQLKGKKWGISSFGSSGNYSVVAMAQNLGWSDKDYEFVTLGNLNGLIAGLKRGTIDAFTWGGTTPYVLESEKQGHDLGSLKDLVGQLPQDVIAVRNDLLTKNPSLVRKFCDTFYGVNKDLMANPDKAEDLFEKWGVKPEIAQEVVKNEIPMLSTKGEFTDEMLTKMVDGTKFLVKDQGNLTVDDVKAHYKPCDSL
jgi:ABC-type nitrate/sulfonate/bicarbonate transport system substrate-binding protein